MSRKAEYPLRKPKLQGVGREIEHLKDEPGEILPKPCAERANDKSRSDEICRKKGDRERPTLAQTEKSEPKNDRPEEIQLNKDDGGGRFGKERPGPGAEKGEPGGGRMDGLKKPASGGEGKFHPEKGVDPEKP